MPREHDPERLAQRIASAMHAEAELQARRQRESEGAKEWAAKHANIRSIRRDPGPVRDRTRSYYGLFGE